MSKSQLIERYSAPERRNHWAVAISFILLVLSGLALFHPAFFFLTNLLGGAVWARILHPFIGVILFALFVYMARGFAQYNHINDNDRKWMKHIKDVISNKDDKLPAVGKYNAGQKYLFWTLVVCISVLFVSGIMIWQPYFASRLPVTLLRIGVLLHALSAFVAIAGIMVHIYAAIWVKGSIRAMTRGFVSKAWAKHHHAAWYKEISK